MPGKKIRVAVLLLVLAWVGVDVLAARLSTTDWREPLWVGVYPVNADGSAITASYLAALEAGDFLAVQDWFETEAHRYGVNLARPVEIRVGVSPAELPPAPPAERSLLSTTWWSLRLAWWADERDALPEGLRPDIRLFLLYYDPADNPRLPHSLGLQKGLVGVVHLYADARYAGSNRVVLAHELLHTLGASDKYDPATAQPQHPDGYAEPDANPLYPQRLAEIMGGRIPASDSESAIPADIDLTRIGRMTASEIRWP